ncbi:MAG: hypothetical protein HC934_08495 [Acaryochloridaceae cyanobacterium SU_2_1]|nr:hypothetical protein [Acaryochloridaceae cyanobacterium SU_2_1]NJM95590.1 hypothetical protein [Acaryochloridaceae cyanobacterium CSU_5_19]
MALEPCRVCGTLNSTEAEICLSCEFPTKGRRRPIIYQWAALGLFLVLTVPLFIVFIYHMKPKPSPQSPPAISAQQ